MKKMNSIPTRAQGGFTLIELVMVIVIIGILSAFALPRFANLAGDAKVSTIKALAGSMKSSMAISHAALLAAGGSATAATATVTLDNQTVNMVYGYPAATAAGIGVAAGIDVNDYTGTGTIVYKPKNYTGTGTCKVTYTAATATTSATVVLPTTLSCS